MIKVENQRAPGSNIFHYAHFLCDCLFPEIVNDVYKYEKVYRKKTIEQTLGNFYKIYEEVMGNKNIEITSEEFDKLETKSLIYNNTYGINDIYNLNKFREFIFARYKISPNIFYESYPEVLLIKRGDRVCLVDDPLLKSINTNITTGKERREIDQINKVEEYLNKLYIDRFKAIFLENMDFKQQIQYFNNAKLIVLAHGAAMSNMFFCKKGTKVIEVTCNCWWPFFEDIVRCLDLELIQCKENTLTNVIEIIDKHKI